MSYLKRTGETVAFIPNPNDYISDNEDCEIEEKYVVEILVNENDLVKSFAYESFYKYPTKEQIRWCLMKYSLIIDKQEKEVRNITARVYKEYSLCW